MQWTIYESLCVWIYNRMVAPNKGSGQPKSVLTDEIVGNHFYEAMYDTIFEREGDEDMGDTCRNGKEWNKCE